jgi:dihydroorotase-like cyclic amidohydrolase
MKTRIENAQVWSEGKHNPLSLEMDAEKISWLVQPTASNSVPVDNILDATGMGGLPGGVDFHVHMSEGAETFQDGSRCAAAGGITTVLDMAPFHACITVDQIVEKASLGEAACVIDFGIIGCIFLRFR